MYQIGDVITHCHIQSIKEKVGNGLLRMVVIDRINEEALLEQMRFMSGIKIPWIVAERNANFSLYCRQDNQIVGPQAVPIKGIHCAFMQT